MGRPGRGSVENSDCLCRESVPGHPVTLLADFMSPSNAV
jgi:hypothetical protein